MYFYIVCLFLIDLFISLSYLLLDCNKCYLIFIIKVKLIKKLLPCAHFALSVVAGCRKTTLTFANTQIQMLFSLYDGARVS